MISTERGFRVGLDFQGATIHFDATNPGAREYVWGNRNMEPQEEQLAAPMRRMKYGVMEKKFMVSVKNIWN